MNPLNDFYSHDKNFGVHSGCHHKIGHRGKSIFACLVDQLYSIRKKHIFNFFFWFLEIIMTTKFSVLIVSIILFESGSFQRRARDTKKIGCFLKPEDFLTLSLMDNSFLSGSYDVLV